MRSRSRTIWAALAAWAAVATAVDAQFHNLRFKEDAYFERGEVEDLGGGWRARFGGQVRHRFQSEANKSLTGMSPQINDFHLTRTRVHGDFRHEDGGRVFVELRDARIHGNERPALGIDQNNVDLLNGFLGFDGDDVSLRAGRTELQYGAQRLISPLDWGNTRRTFDGAVASVEGEGWVADAFVARPVMVNGRDRDRDDNSRWFGGVYATAHHESGGTDVYALALDEDDKVFTARGKPGDGEVYTVGARHWGKHGNTDYEVEVAQQRGDFAGNKIDAHMVTVRGGQTFPDVSGKPRVGVDFDFASGDSSPGDGTTETFNQHFPLGHAYLGYVDLVGRQNIVDIQPNVTVQTSERTTVKAAYHFFNLADRRDALYNAGGVPILADPTGGSSDTVGEELDLSLVWKPESLAPHGHVLAGYSRFLPGRFVETLGDNSNVDLFYLQFTLTF